MFIVPRSQIIPVFSNDIYPVIDNPFIALYDVTSPVVRHEVDIREPASWLIYYVIVPHDRCASSWFNPQVSFRAIHTQIGKVIGFPCPWLKNKRKWWTSKHKRGKILIYDNKLTAMVFLSLVPSLLSLWKTAQNLGYSLRWCPVSLEPYTLIISQSRTFASIATAHL